MVSTEFIAAIGKIERDPTGTIAGAAHAEITARSAEYVTIHSANRSCRALLDGQGECSAPGGYGDRIYLPCDERLHPAPILAGLVVGSILVGAAGRPKTTFPLESVELEIPR